ncbi:hypothetical protein V6N12_051113 [Hibiscus sabdariffa]|uniref:Uncharacterized protein n=1 Tax=Hibiscus sabdariffa TaxID=183260 RepID=A0ABR2GEE3_9ROSI
MLITEGLPSSTFISEPIGLSPGFPSSGDFSSRRRCFLGLVGMSALLPEMTNMIGPLLFASPSSPLTFPLLVPPVSFASPLDFPPKFNPSTLQVLLGAYVGRFLGLELNVVRFWSFDLTSEGLIIRALTILRTIVLGPC